MPMAVRRAASRADAKEWDDGMTAENGVLQSHLRCTAVSRNCSVRWGDIRWRSVSLECWRA